jgi:hypothetical protein
MTETLNYQVDYLEEFYTIKDLFTVFQKSKAADTVTHTCMNNP